MEKFRIAIISDKDSWFTPYADALANKLRAFQHDVCRRFTFDEQNSYDICFILSYSKIITPKALRLNKNNIVVHASALPKGKGMSPLTWQILEGRSEIPLTLFEAVERVDAGKIYLQRSLQFEGTELIDALRQKMGTAIIGLCLEFINRYPKILLEAREQQGEESFYKWRHPKDSQLDIDRTIREQFNLLRVVDNERYPAFFYYQGQRYRLAIYDDGRIQEREKTMVLSGVSLVNGHVDGGGALKLFYAKGFAVSVLYALSLEEKAA